MANILYISYDGMTDPLGQSQVLPYLQGLSAAGYSITLLSAEKKERYESSKEAIAQIMHTAGIKWVPLMYTKRPPGLSTLYDVIRLRKKAVKMHKQKAFDLVHCRSYISALIGLYMKRRFNVPFIFDMRGFWADERVDGGLWDLRKTIYKTAYNYFKKKEIEFIKESDCTVSLTHNGRDEILSWPQLKNIPVDIQIIPCCADLDLFDYRHLDSNKLKALRDSLGIKPNDFIINYSGAVGTWYLLKDMLRFFKLLKQHKPTARFLILTTEDHAMVYAQAAEVGVQATDLILKSGKRFEMPYYLACSQLALFFIKPAYSKKASSPTKQGEIMGMGIPIICNSGIGDTDKVIHDYNAGIVLSDLTNSSMTAAIKQIDTLSLISATSIRHGAEDFYALHTGVQRYINIYIKIVGAP